MNTDGDPANDRTLPQSTGERQRAIDRSLRTTGPPGEVPGVDLEHRLGEGAYGEVWVGVSRRTGRRVAVKFYAHRGGLDWTLLAREVEKLSFLFGNRYVVQLLDIGWDAEPPYYVMEYMPEGSLEDLLARGPIPIERMLGLFRDVATGLIHAHGKGVLHCDLKPANVLIGADGKPRLADFGQSRLTNEQQPALGTLFYMAPEQADLQAVPDVRWDVYALGALAYRMLTGQAPHRTTEATDQMDGGGDLEHRLARYRELIRSSPPPRLHRRVAGVDRWLAEIIERCLEIDPKRRFPNVQALCDALDARNRRLARQPLLILGALGPALLLLVLTFFAWGAYRAAVGQSEAAVVQRVLESNRFAAQFVSEAVAQQIDQRWRILEDHASNSDFADLVAEAAPLLRDALKRRELQSRLEAMRAAAAQISSTSWFVNAGDGRQIARSPLNENTIDRNYAFRDYFHGLGHDLPPEASGELRPIRRPHRSIVFTSQATGNRMVAFSVPIFASGGLPEDEPIGVLAMTVELGKFAELRPEVRSSGSQVALLADRRPDAQGRPGAILEHPYLAALLSQRKPLPAAYLDPADVDRLGELSPLLVHGRLAATGESGATDGFPEGDAASVALIAEAQEPQQTVASVSEDRSRHEGGQEARTAESAALAAANEDAAWSSRINRLKLVEDFHDPLAEHDPAYDGRWLAAFSPVLIDGRPADLQDTGWAVIVQEKYVNAIQPVRQLGARLLRQWMIAMGTVAGVLTVLWGVVALLLNESRRGTTLARWRKRFGLSSTVRTEPPSTATYPMPQDDSGSAQ